MSIDESFNDNSYKTLNSILSLYNHDYNNNQSMHYKNIYMDSQTTIQHKLIIDNIDTFIPKLFTTIDE